MGRFDDLKAAIGRVASPKIEDGDETTTADNPRNLASGYINKVLPDSFQIPMQTVAEDKKYMQELPELIAGSTMGKLGEIPKISPRFGKLVNQVSNSDVMTHPEMLDFLANNKLMDRVKFPHPSQYEAAKQALANKLRGI